MRRYAQGGEVTPPPVTSLRALCPARVIGQYGKRITCLTPLPCDEHNITDVRVGAILYGSAYYASDEAPTPTRWQRLRVWLAYANRRTVRCSLFLHRWCTGTRYNGGPCSCRHHGSFTEWQHVGLLDANATEAFGTALTDPVWTPLTPDPRPSLLRPWQAPQHPKEPRR